MFCHYDGGTGKRKKKLKRPADAGSARGLAGDQLAGERDSTGSIVLEQMWSLEKNLGISRKGRNYVSLTAARAVFLPPREWTQILLPYKLMIEGRVSIFCALSKKGVLANVTVTNGGQIKVNAYNATDETIYLTPKTILVNLVGAQVSVKRFGTEGIERIISLIVDEKNYGEK